MKSFIMRFKKLLKKYDKYCMNPRPHDWDCFSYLDSDCFIVWYFKQKYYSQPQQCPECKQIKMLLYDIKICSDCWNKFLNDLLEKIKNADNF